ncbi:hypothetical protein TNCT_598061 [Trichonephila clavata]|uniref:Uncharacterized protein n=1 Tax=Trichonephila clavata TaxID=2740835 RepID=A0A8X6F1E4_TRICU|nr:hypothetical protein TNCT_598061 [Trichonephila clavata]
MDDCNSKREFLICSCVSGKIKNISRMPSRNNGRFARLQVALGQHLCLWYYTDAQQNNGRTYLLPQSNRRGATRRVADDSGNMQHSPHSQHIRSRSSFKNEKEHLARKFRRTRVSCLIHFTEKSSNLIFNCPHSVQLQSFYLS